MNFQNILSLAKENVHKLLNFWFLRMEKVFEKEKYKIQSCLALIFIFIQILKNFYVKKME